MNGLPTATAVPTSTTFTHFSPKERGDPESVTGKTYAWMLNAQGNKQNQTSGQEELSCERGEKWCDGWDLHHDPRVPWAPANIIQTLEEFLLLPIAYFQGILKILEGETVQKGWLQDIT